MPSVYIYALADPRTKQVRYVGQTVDVGNRYRSHLQETNSNPKSQWVDVLKAVGKKPHMIILDVVSAEDANEAEQQWVRIFENTATKLLNVRYTKIDNAPLIEDDASRLVAFMNEQGMSSADLSRALGTAKAVISKVINRKIPPSYTFMWRFLCAFGPGPTDSIFVDESNKPLKRTKREHA